MTKQILRSLLLFIAGISMLMPLLSDHRGKALYTNQVAVLMYHHVTDEDTSSGTITTKLFEDQLTYLRDKGYTFISLEQFGDYMNGSAVPDNAVLVTFDDGYESFRSNSFPILDRLDIPAVNFIITDTLDQPDAYNIPFMSRDDIRAVTSARPFAISAQCHTHGMHNNAETPYMVTRLPINGTVETDEQYRGRLIGDMQACIGQLTPLGPEKVEYLAYPYGVFNKEAAQYVREGGIRYAFTIVPEMSTRRRDPMALPRINAGSPHITPQRLHQTIMRAISM